jgi:asparagine synthase (glutamine-hydrolysing)
MVGIASKNAPVPVIGRMKRSFISPLSWIALGGGDIYDAKAVCVSARSDIYNFHELSQKVCVRPQSDAGLIGELYLLYGQRVFEMLTGPFSVCLVDKITRKLIVVIDRLGIKPIVYYSDKNSFIFGSRIQTLLPLASADAREIDNEALMDYLNFSAVPTPKTIFRRIRKLPPGHFLAVKGGDLSPQLTKYCDISYPIENRGKKYFLKEIPEAVEASVKLVLGHEMLKGRRVGAFLSGGTDSSTVTGMMKKISGSVKTFSIGFDEPGYNELDYAHITARHFGAQHHEYVVTPDDVLRSVDSVIDAFDEPFGNASAVPTYFCARLAKENGIDTLMAGDGGDEIFGGNERYAADKIFSNYYKIPCSLRKRVIEPLVASAPAALPVIERGKKYIRRANIPHPERFFSYNPVSAMGKEVIFSPEFLNAVNGYDPVAWARELYETVEAEDELNKLLYIDMKFTITDNDLRKVNAASEKVGLRVAYPLLDRKLVDLTCTMPASLKVRGRTLRYLFKKAFTGFLPADVIRKKKHGFGLPIGIWIRTKKNITDFVMDALRGPSCTISPFFRNGFIDELFKLHRENGVAFYGDIIWNLLVLELWSKRQQRVRNDVIT